MVFARVAIDFAHESGILHEFFDRERAFTIQLRNMSPYDRIINALASATNDNTEQTRRRFPRRMLDVCVAEVDGTTYPVSDWSQCGVLFEADGRSFEVGHDAQVVMKFKLSGAVSEIPVKAKVVRTGKKKVALEFVSLPKKIEKAFAKVIEDAMNHPPTDVENRG